MTEHPIIFSGPMVRAILEGRKTQTRRPIKKPIILDWLGQFLTEFVASPANHLSPYGYAGDRLWVRETHAGDNLCGWVYRADHPTADIKAGELDDGEQSLRRWTPAIHMKREACRLRLDVTAVRIERLLDITKDDAIAEGMEIPQLEAGAIHYVDGARGAYGVLWDKLNAKRGYGWVTNPWVWVIGFKVAS